MNRDLHFTKLFKQVLILVLVTMGSTVSSYAGESGYFDYYANLSVQPTGAGTVYVDMQESDNLTLTDAMDEPLSDMSTPSDDNIEVKYIYKNLSNQPFNAVATPKEGWIFAGYSACRKNEEDEHVFNDSIFSRTEKSTITLKAKTSNDDLATAQNNFPLAPDTTFYALFTHIAVNVCTGQDSLGVAKISKVCNDIDDEVTLTATPLKADHTKFDYWIKKETGEKIATNPLKLKVNECAHYEAHFTSDLADVINFPEEGGLALYYSGHASAIPENVKVLTFSYNSWDTTPFLQVNDKTQKCICTPDTAGYQVYAKDPCILLGKGEATLYHFSDETNDYSTSYFKMNGDEAVSVASLPVANHYYTINLEKQQFELLADNATIPANTMYWALPNERYEAVELTAAPSIIYWNDPDATTGISNANTEKATKITHKGIYNLQGQKVERMTNKGLYIIDGKKVINLAK